MFQPKVSIVIPLFNRESLILNTLNSLLSQSYQDWEAIVVDDHSTDKSGEVVVKLAALDTRIRYFKGQIESRGAPICRNIGLENAKGGLIIFLDSDDVLAPWCLENRVEQFEKYPHLDFLVFPILLFAEIPGDSNILFSSYSGDDALTKFINQESPWQTMGPIWKKESIKKIGGWDEGLATWQDWELPIRAMLKGLQYKIVGGLPDCFLRRSEHDRLSSNDMKLSRLESKLMLFKKVIIQIKNEDLLTGEYKKAFARLYLSHAERTAIRMPGENITDRFLQEMKGLKVLSRLQLPVILIYIKFLRLTQQVGLKKATSIVYKLGHSFLPSSVRSVEMRPAFLEHKKLEVVKKFLNNAI